jgi:hypothetical protein
MMKMSMLSLKPKRIKVSEKKLGLVLQVEVWAEDCLGVWLRAKLLLLRLVRCSERECLLEDFEGYQKYRETLKPWRSVEPLLEL